MNTSSKCFLVPALFLLGLGPCLAACSGDSSATGGGAGASGSSGGGATGKGGAAGSTGQAGNAVGGQDSGAGKGGGTATSGNGGSEVVGGNGGSDGGAVTGGSGGSAVMGGSGGGGALKMCSPGCQVDADCEVGKVDGLSGLPSFCSESLKRCMPVTYCDQPDDCIPWASVWLEPCKSNMDCTLPDLEVCVSHLLSGEGSGVCASPPSDGKCPGALKVTAAKRFGTGEAVQVCASTEGLSCTQHQCATPSCDADSCSGRGACNAATKQCECTADSDCTVPGASSCNTTSHTCECKDADDCSDGWSYTKSEPVCQ